MSEEQDESLSRIRERIDEIDRRLLKALAARREAVAEVSRIKSESHAPLQDPRREQEILSRLISLGHDHGLDPDFITRVYREVIKDSVRSQQRLLEQESRPRQGALRVSFQGIHGAFSHLAAREFFAADLERTSFDGCATFEEVVRSVEEGESEYALLPVENTTAGSINEVYGLLAETGVSIVGEQVYRIEHCLLTLEEIPLHYIRRVLSHPQGFAQCSLFLSRLASARFENFHDTAMAVRRVREDNNLSQAAIASEEAGRMYDLTVLHRDIANQQENFTRFLVIALEPVGVAPGTPCKTSLLLATPHEEGALLKALDVFHRHRINLSKLESRPSPGKPFQYQFYVDFEGNLADPDVEAAIGELEAATSYLKVLGSYPARKS